MRQMFEAAVACAHPDQFMAAAVERWLPQTDKGRIFVTGFGKASAVMARAFEQAVPANIRKRIDGMVIVPDGHEESCDIIEIISAAHPVPDARGLAAAENIMAAAHSLDSDDLMIVLVSGGGSSLFCLPHEAVGFARKQEITGQLLRGGAPIDEMNCVRKHLSAGKGGQLAAAAYPARCCAFAISDVPGDDPAVIASGPTVADNSTAAQALEILKKYRIEAAEEILAHLNSPDCETPAGGDVRLSRSHLHLVATPAKSLAAAAHVAEQAGYKAIILGDDLEGESRALAKSLAAEARAARPGTALISGGETTVVVRGSGSGGRNAEFIHALGLEGCFYALAADTDGIDGAAPVAGAYITPDMLVSARERGLDAAAYLENNDSHSFFAALGTQIVTGPTRTNVNDFRVILV